MNRNDIIIHCYPPRVDSSNGFYTIKNNVIEVQKDFDQALKRLNDYRMADKIWLTTIRDFLDFRTSLENVSYEIAGDGKVLIKNNGREAIRGLTFSVSGIEYNVEGKKINSKRDGNSNIYWFDIEPGEIVIMSSR
jgi:hypothetical protein